MNRVLIVSQDSETIAFLRAQLRGQGYEVEEARDSEQALEKARRNPPRMVVSDLGIPAKEGLTLLRRWKADAGLRSVPVVVCSATPAGPGEEQQARDLGAEAFIDRPREPGRLLAEIRAVLEGRVGGGAKPAVSLTADTGGATGEHSEVLVTRLGERAIELERANRELAEREARLRAIFETQPECVKLLAADGTFLEMNPAGLRMIEAGSYAEVEKRCIYPLIVPEHLAAFRGLTERVFRGESGSLEFEFIGLKGGRRWLEIHASPLRDSSDNVSALLGITRDITDRKRTDLDLQQALASLQSFVDSVPSFIAFVDARERYELVNKRYVDWFGLPRERIVGHELRELHRPATYATMVPQIREVMAGREARYDSELTGRDGKDYCFDVRYVPRRSPDGAVIGYFVLAMDVTERKRAAEALRVSESRYRRLVDSNVVGVIIARTDGRITESNARFLEMIGYTREDLLGGRVRWDAITPPDWAHVDVRVIEELRATGVCRTFEKEYVRKDGGRIAILLTAALVDGMDSDCVCLIEDITERKAVEHQILEQNRLLAETQRIGRIGTWSWDLASDTPGWSEEAFRIHGRSPRDFQLTPASFLALIHPEDRPAVERWIIDCREGRAPGELEFRVHRGDGEVRTLSGRGELVPAAGGRPARMMGTVQDITDRKNAERAVRESDARYRAIFEQAAVGVARVGLDGRWLEANQRVCDIVGYTRDELLTRTFQDITHPDDLGADLDNLLAVLSGEIETYSMEKRYLHREGQAVWVNLSVSLVRSADGSPAYFVAVIKDIGDRKAAQQALSMSEERLRMAVQASNIGFWDWDVRTDRIIVSPEWKRQLGYENHEMGDEVVEWEQRIHPDDRPSVLDRIRECVARAQSPPEIEYRMRHKDGSWRWFQSRAELKLDANGAPARLMGGRLDVTARKLAEDQRVKLEAQMGQAQKLEALGTLAGGIAHDFNNMLFAIAANIDLARMDLPAEHAAQRSLAEIGTVCTHARDLVRQILAFSRRQPMSRDALHLADVSAEAVRLLRATIPSGIDLVTTLAAGTPAVLADRTQILQVIVNLCTNAWHAIGRGPGRIDVTVAPFTQPANDCRGDLKPGAYARLSVADTGEGMSPDTLSRIFDPFFTTKKAGEGTGLGLAVVHGIVASHDGDIKVQSEPGEGSIFHVYLPAAEDGVVKAESSTTVVPRGAGERVMLVDDQRALVSVVTQLLTRLGYKVTACANAEEALAAFQTEPDSFDLIFSDWNMPGMSGLDLAVRLMQARPDLPVLLASGYVTGEMQEQALRAGIREIISKPVSGSDIARAVHRHLNTRGTGRTNAAQP